MAEQYVKVHLLNALPFLDIPYTYQLPFELKDEVLPGMFVTVPYGRANRRCIALVTERTDNSDYAVIKPVDNALPAVLQLSAEELSLCAFMKEQFFCTIGDAARTILPTGAIGKLENRYFAVPGALAPDKDDAGKKLFKSISQKPEGMNDSMLLRDAGIAYPRSDKQLRCLLDNGLVQCRAVLRGGDNQKKRMLAALAIGGEDAMLLADGDDATRKKYHFRAKSESYATLLRTLADGADHEALELLQETGASTANLTLLEKNGIIDLRREAVDRNPYEKYENYNGKSPAPVALSLEQTKAFDILSALCSNAEPKAALLYGVTGSGKTSVMKKLIDQVLKDGKQVIMLLPEIALTPQSVGIFCAFYPNRVAVLHSALSAGEQLDAWRRIRADKVDLVIGTRSAVFAPLKRLGMIIMDEEQEHTYKSDQTPKYHARDIARFRCAKSNAFLLLASATPSLESYEKAVRGVYTLVRLTERYGGAVLPKVEMADLRESVADARMNPVGPELHQAIRETLDAKEQSILFINRRGYHNYVSCMSCGEALMCPRCSVTFTYHVPGCRAHIRIEEDKKLRRGNLICHYCGYRIPVPSACPACGDEHLKYFGYGTQRTQEELETEFPDARILRMDADTTRTKFAHAKILDAFRRHEADILVGTQMVTKGHDFPDVTLVGVLNADGMLYQDDYRAAEKTFSMLTQVVGRAGRGDRAGRAIIQTYQPSHEILKLAAKQDYESFFKGAIAIRKSLSFPPFCDIALLSFAAQEEGEVQRTAMETYERLKSEIGNGGSYSDVPLAIFGPFEASVYKLSERFRMRLILKCVANRRCRAMLRQLLTEAEQKAGNRVSIGIDINPSSL